jgi:hypothetical protein
MKEDYLWDKTGTDAEIEKLEKTLQVFRAETNIAPAIVRASVPVAEESPRRRFFSFSRALAFAASLMFVLILVGVWFQVPTKNISVGDNLAQTITPEIGIEIPDPPAEKPPAPVIKKPGTFAPNKIKFAEPSVRQDRTTAGPKSKTRNPKPKIVLTEEEKYAYDQLMLALSITSSKLKMVRDKVDGIENQKIIVKQEDKTRRN